MCKTSMPSHHIPISKKINFEAYVSQHSDGISKMVFGGCRLVYLRMYAVFSPFPIPGGMLVDQTIRLRREEDLFVLRATVQHTIG